MYGDDIVKELYEYAVENGRNSDIVISLYDGEGVDFDLYSSKRGEVRITPSQPLALQSDVDELESKIETLEEEIADLSDALAQERKEVNLLEDEIRALRVQLSNYDE